LSALRLVLSPSPRLAALIVVLHAGAAAGALASVPGIAGAALAAALLALGATSAWGRALLRAGGAVRAIEVTGEEIVLELASGARLEGTASSRRYVSRFVVVLLVGAPARRAVLVAGDMLDPEMFRRLRVWALWGRAPGRKAVAGKQLQA
jgi:hypothetical protein